MSRTDLMGLAIAERSDFAELLRSLGPDQWRHESLCAEWTVRDVAVHVVSYDELSKAETVGTFLRGGLRAGRVNDVALRKYADLDPTQILDLHERCLRPHGLPAGFGGGIALTDGTIHQQDIRRALGLPREIPEKRLTAVLDFSLTAPTLPSKSNRKGLRLVATDLDWASGHGPEVTGPGEAILMAAAGRAHALPELDGPGLPTLRRRVG